MCTEEIEEWVKVLEKHPDVYVIADEIYEKILFTDKPKSLGSYPSLKGRIATVNGLSKGYAMTGWRIGYMAGPKEWIQACEKYQGMISSGANSVGQAAGAFALHNLAAQQEVENMRISFNKRRQLMSQMIADIHGMNCPEPQGAFYYFPDVSHYFGQTTADGKRIMNSDDLCMYLLETAHVATVSGSAFGTPSCIRLSYAASEEQLTEAMKRISKALSQLN
jgi:aspartate aminotransferase